MKALKAFIKPSEAPQRSVKTKHLSLIFIYHNSLNAQGGKG